MYAVTLVYNLRVRRVFNIPPIIERMKSRLLLTAVPIVFTRKRHLVDARTNLDAFEKRRAGGTIFNARYVPSKHWWAEATTGIEKDFGKFTGSDNFNASRVGFDDVVLAGGYRHFVGDRVQLVGYGLAGLPTRRKVDLNDRHGPLVGTRIYNVGFGAEASYAFVSCLRRSVAAVMQTRFIHGFNRSWFPILPEGAKLQPGNSVDMLFTLQFRNRRTVVETGYDATLFANQGIILPNEKIVSDLFVRHSGYATISHIRFNTFFGKPLVFGAGCSVTYTKKLDARTFTGWLHCSTVF